MASKKHKRNAGESTGGEEGPRTRSSQDQPGTTTRQRKKKQKKAEEQARRLSGRESVPTEKKRLLLRIEKGKSTKERTATTLRSSPRQKRNPDRLNPGQNNTVKASAKTGVDFNDLFDDESTVMSGSPSPEKKLARTKPGQVRQ